MVDMHQNNFMHIVNAQEVIDMQHKLIEQAVANNKQFKATRLESIQNKLVGIAQYINDYRLKTCPVQTPGCKGDQAKVTHEVFEPFPTVLNLNINWFDNQVSYMDTLFFCCGIPSRFQIN